MKRSPPPKRKTPLPRATKPLRRTRIKRRATSDRDEACAWRDEVIRRAKGRCEACPVIAEALDGGAFLGLADTMPYQATRAETEAMDVVRACDGRATDAHHREARGMGGHGDNDPDSNPGVACCHQSHMWLESHREIAESLGLIRRHGKPRKGLARG